MNKVIGVLLLSTLSLSVFGQKKWIKRGDEAFQGKDYYCALINYAKADKGKDYHVTMRMAQCFRKIKRFNAAAKYYEKAVTFGGIQPEIMLEYAYLLLYQRKYNDAQKYFEKYSLAVGGESKVTSLQGFLKLRTTTESNSIEVLPNTIPDDCFTVDGNKANRSNPHLYDYFWEFSDGKKYKGYKAEHCFQERGDHFVYLHLRNRSTGVTDSAVIRMDLEAPYSPTFKYTGNLSPNKDIEFDARSIINKDKSILYVVWDFDDGTYAVGEKATHQFGRTGQFRVKLWLVKDGPDGKPQLTTQIMDVMSLNLRFQSTNCTELDIDAILEE